MLTKPEAVKRLTKRYEEQAEKYPMMRDDISLALYLKRNLSHVMNSVLENPLSKYAG